MNSPIDTDQPPCRPRRTRTTALTVMLIVFGMACGVAKGADREKATAAARIVFLVSEDPDNYEATKTIPPYAQMLGKEHGYRTTVLSRTGTLNAASFPGLVEALSTADLLVVFSRRVALPKDQIDALKAYLKAGKPLVGIRTANHGFAPRGEIAAGHQAWPEFVPDVLGAENRGYSKPPHGFKVSVAPGAENHPILQGIDPTGWQCMGSLYLTAPLLDQKATVLLNGQLREQVEPIAWTRRLGPSRIFYTSLGYPDDFNVPQFRTLLLNGIRWALDANARSK